MSTAGTKRKHLDIKINVEPKPKKQNHSKNRKSKSETKKATQKASKCPPILHYHASTEEKFEGQYQFEVYRPKDHNKQEPMLLVTQQVSSAAGLAADRLEIASSSDIGRKTTSSNLNVSLQKYLQL